MKILSLSFLTVTAMLLQGSPVSAQHQPGCNCQHGGGMVDAGYGMSGAGYGMSGGTCGLDGCCAVEGCGAGATGCCPSGSGCRCPLFAGKGFPDAGWAPPARMPVNRDRAWYQAWHPQAFYGNSGGGFIANYPQVYQPSDTTQLGYSYQIVPTWQSRPGMIPPVPRPSEFHARVTPAAAHGGCETGSCYGNASSCFGHAGSCDHYSGYAQSVPYTGAHSSHIAQPARYSRSGSPFRMSSLSNLFD